MTTPGSDILGAAAQRLMDLGLSGVAILALSWMFWQLWKARESDRKAADERYAEVQEKRITEQRAALDAVSKAVDTLDTAMEMASRSHQQ